MLKVCSPEIPPSIKTGPKKNVSWEHSEIARKRAWKRSTMKLFYQSSMITILTLHSSKNDISYISRGLFESLPKLSILSNLMCSIWSVHSQLCWKQTPLQILLLSVNRLFKITCKSSVVESIFSKVIGEISY